MTNRRSLVLAIALLLSLLAGGIAYGEAHSAQQNADKSTTLVWAYVSQRSIPRDTTGAQALAAGLIKATQVPERFRPPTAVTRTSAIQNEVALENIVADQVIVAGLFGSASTAPSAVADTIPKNDVAISVSVDQIHGVAGLVAPGDRVDILVDLDGSTETFLYQDVRVLAVDDQVAGLSSGQPSSASVGNGSGSSSSSIITFAVPTDAAVRIAAAVSNTAGVSGSIYLALVSPDTAPVAPTAITSQNLLGAKAAQ